MKKPTRHSCMPNKFASFQSVENSLRPILGKLKKLSFLKTLSYVFDEDEIVEEEEMPFPHPTKDTETQLMNYYLLDPASILAAESLNVEPFDLVLDLCAAPGGKTLVLCQALSLMPEKPPPSHPHMHNRQHQPEKETEKEKSKINKFIIPRFGSLVANELSTERRMRLKTTLKNYLPPAALERVKVTAKDGTKWSEIVRYDKVLVDAPCSSERHLLEDEDQLLEWTPSRTKSNASRQAKLLKAALSAVKPGGRVVYITCSISEIENDGVVEKVLFTDVEKKKKRKERQKMQKSNGKEEKDSESESENDEEQNSKEEESSTEEEKEEKNKEEKEQPLQQQSEEEKEKEKEILGKVIIHEQNFAMGEKTKHGLQIFPDVCDGFGPLYISIIQRLTEVELLKINEKK